MKLVTLRVKKKGLRQALRNVKLEFRGEASAGDTLLIIKQSYILYITNYFHLRILGTEMTTEEIRSAKERSMTKVNP